MTTIDLAQWITPTLHRTPGRDPLALQTITQDRIIPFLLPGVLAGTRRARYFSFHCFLLDEYRRRELAPSKEALSKFILAREYELALAVELCPRGCLSSPVGRLRSGPATATTHEAYARGESVRSRYGAYGLYYRTPLLDLGVVVPAGTLLGEEPIPIDVLATQGRGPALADAFRSTIASTAYFNELFTGLGPVPHDALVEYSSAACLCRLDEHTEERDLLREAIFEPTAEGYEGTALQRRQSFALFLAVLRDDPQVASAPVAFRTRVWEQFLGREELEEARTRVVSQWAALFLKEYMQESLSAIWIDLCRSGLRNQPDDGFSPPELTTMLRSILAAPRRLDIASQEIACDPSMRMGDLNEAFASAAAGLSLEEIRDWARDEESVVAGLLFLKVVCDRLPARESFSDDDKAFLEVGVQHSMRQKGLLQVAQALEVHLSEDPTLADTVEWAVRELLITVHERVAYSRLPNFTFRFRWEGGRLRFYDLGVWPFDMADMRHGSLAQLSIDLGYWMRDGTGGGDLTSDGSRFVAEVFE